MCDSWAIRMQHNVTHNIYFLSDVRIVDGLPVAVGCMRYRARFGARLFSTLGESFSVIKRCSPSQWNFRVIPASRIPFRKEVPCDG